MLNVVRVFKLAVSLKRRRYWNKGKKSWITRRKYQIIQINSLRFRKVTLRLKKIWRKERRLDLSSWIIIVWNQKQIFFPKKWTHIKLTN